MVRPALSALLPDAPLDLVGNAGPLLGPRIHAVDDDLVLLIW